MGKEEREIIFNKAANLPHNRGFLRNVCLENHQILDKKSYEGQTGLFSWIFKNNSK